MGRFAFWKKNTGRRELGLYLGPKSCWVVAKDSPDSALELPLDGDNWPALMASISSHFGPAALAIVLGFGRYQLLLADKPAVADNEMLDAIKWAIKDMVSEPVSSLKLDYFESPNQSSNKITVVAVERSALEALVKAADEVGSSVSGIGIEELVTARLFGSEAQARLVVSHVPSSELLFTVVKDGRLWMQRRVRGFADLNSISEQDLSYGAAHNLSLELQRSMDYFESQLRQAPVAAIELATEGASAALAKLVAGNFNQKVAALPPRPVGHTFAMLACEEFMGEQA